MSAINKNKIILIVGIIGLVFIIKILLNNLLLAENGDTYDFFKVAYQLRHLNLDYQSKRNPFLPLLLAPFPTDLYILIGRVWINVFYFLSIWIFYKLTLNKIISNCSKSVTFKKIQIISICATVIFATNIVILENSFYILADAIFLFWNLLFIYIFDKYKLKKPSVLALITAMAFYTRPEGSILFVGIVIYTICYYLRLKKSNSNISFIETNFIDYLLYLTIFILPHFMRNYYLYNNIFYSGYLKDEAGFLFNINSLGLRISNFAFGLGGVWFIPFLTTMFLIIKNKINAKNDMYFILLIIYSIILIAWGPYIRLYSIPLALLIIFIFSLLAKTDISKSKKITVKSALLLFITLIVSIIFYFYAVQELDHTDLGYRKLGKGLSIVFSLPIVLILLMYLRKRIEYLKFILLITFFISALNLIIFIEKFSITRYKYYTLRQATELYLDKYSTHGKLAYDSGSGLEAWYTKDFERKNDFLPSINGNLFDFAKKKNVKFIVETKELGYRDKFSDYGKLNSSNSKIIQTFESPFFSGKTYLIELVY